MSTIYIIGHKSPDLDSVAAAISYANLKKIQDSSNDYQPAVAGKLNKETKYVLKKFGFNAPKILENAKNKNIIMVDHNEFSQTADGMGEAKIVEVLDHHKVNFSYSCPITFRALPWGATCSIIADKYLKNNIAIEKNLAGLILAAILIDTIITKSPTCAEEDKNIIEKLAKLARINSWKEFGMELFKVRSNVQDLSAIHIIKNDFKDWNFKAGRFGVGQIETVNLNEFTPREDELLAALNKLKESENYHTVILFITDILKEGSQFLIASSDLKKVEEALNAEFKNNRVYIDGMLSRKKQVIPRFTKTFDK